MLDIGSLIGVLSSINGVWISNERKIDEEKKVDLVNSVSSLTGLKIVFFILSISPKYSQSNSEYLIVILTHNLEALLVLSDPH